MVNCRSIPIQNIQSAQAQNADELYYTYQGQKILLNRRENAIAVIFQPNQARTLKPNRPLYLQLQDDIQSNTRSGDIIQVQPLGETAALVKLNKGSRNFETLTQKIIQKSYVQSTLPVLTLTTEENTIVLPNEIECRIKKPDRPKSICQII